jgi:hypothetical protein
MHRPLLFQINGRHLVYNQLNDSTDDDGTSTDSSDQGENILNDILDAAPQIITASKPSPSGASPIVQVQRPHGGAPTNNLLIIGGIGIILLVILMRD